MPTLLARLRDDLDFLPSPVPDRPGLLVRDPFRYSDVAIVLPPPLIQCLTCFDGAHTLLDLQTMILGISEGPNLDDTVDGLVRGLSEAGFLDNDVFRGLRAVRHQAFADAPVRQAAFAGGGYPENRSTLARTIEKWIAGRTPPTSPEPQPSPAASPLVAIAAPHVSPGGGISSYSAAYRSLGAELAERTFVILGTSHYGRPNRFGLTRKGFQTPLGEAITDTVLVDQLANAAPGSVEVEDYCHAVEHSIEFQVLFLQTLFGPSVRILPVLCGPFIPEVDSSRGPATAPGRPEDAANVARALDALGELQAAHGSRLFWVLGVDMAHVGRRYGDEWDARAHDDSLRDVAIRDRARMGRIVDGDADGFWRLLHERGEDDLKWCGSAPLYAFLRANPGVRGRILDYDQWNIDERSVVSFGALAFGR